MKTAYDVLIRPVLTEKAVKQNEKEGKLVFEVDIRANKIQIRKAVEEALGVEVKDVKTLIVKPKKKRVGFSKAGYTKKWKKAIITIKSDKPVNISELV